MCPESFLELVAIAAAMEAYLAAEHSVDEGEVADGKAHSEAPPD